MDKQSRREALRQYKEKTPAVGVFAVRCAASGETWVAASRNLDQQQNGVWFALKHGGHPNRALQAAWQAHGEAAFAFERLETLDVKDHSPLAVELMLKDAEARWRRQLGAGKVAG
ncbi:MAG TPA: GIY-YIG nuclease family protein [Phenylobacterium sp.]|jgi:hypothetical protein|nr:GIY-YIG nuclease family protein [Phenylobacterium sp.]